MKKLELTGIANKELSSIVEAEMNSQGYETEHFKDHNSLFVYKGMVFNGVTIRAGVRMMYDYLFCGSPEIKFKAYPFMLVIHQRDYGEVFKAFTSVENFKRNIEEFPEFWEEFAPADDFIMSDIYNGILMFQREIMQDISKFIISYII